MINFTLRALANKQSNKKNKPYLVLCSAGLGDAVLLFPLIKQLAGSRGVHVLFYSPYQCSDLLNQLDFVEKCWVLKSRRSLLMFILKNYKKYHHLYINHLFEHKKWIYLMRYTAEVLVLNNKAKALMELSDTSVHDAERNLNMAIDRKLSYANFNIQANLKPFAPSLNLVPYGNYIVVQASSANSLKSAKNWALDHWKNLLLLLVQEKPNLRVILIGDANEVQAGAFLSTIHPNIHSFIGKTNLLGLVEVIMGAQLYLGLDAGPMHLAVALGKPTFTIWGPSDPLLYGYQSFDKEKHLDYCLHLPCHPCQSWLSPNTLRVKDFRDCPDYKCVQSIDVQEVYKRLLPFINQHIQQD